MLTGRRAVISAGFILVAIGILSLYLSDHVHDTWWDATLQALGVGFIVGGVIDVVAISGLNRIVETGDLKRQQAELDKRALAILASPHPSWADANLLLTEKGPMDPDIRKRLQALQP